MPGLDGTGPFGTGPRGGRGRGFRPFGLGWFGSGRRGVGGVSVCVCPKCGYSEPHVRGIPCTEKNCPKCDTLMRGDYCAPTQSSTESVTDSFVKQS